MKPRIKKEISQKEHEFWNLYSFFYDAINFSIPYQNLMNLLVNELDIQEGQKILDFGCGTGNLGKVIGLRDIYHIKVEAIDYSQSMLKKARKKCAIWNYISFAKVDLNHKLPYEDDSFDSIVGNNVIYSVSNQEFTLSELCRVLKPGGKIVISDPKKDAKIKYIVGEHLKSVSKMPIAKRIWNYFKFILTMPIAGIPPIMLSLLVINKRQQKGLYHYSNKEKLVELFMKFKTVNIESIYAHQSWLIKGYKEEN